jgi:hypothetical protein
MLMSWPPSMIPVVMPTTSPNWLNSGPPLDPCEIGAEICRY